MPTRLRKRLSACERSPASHRVRDVKTRENRPSPSLASPAKGFLFLNCSARRQGWAGITAGSSVLNASRGRIGIDARRRVGGWRRDVTGDCPRNDGRSRLQVGRSAGCAGRRAGRGTSAGRLAVIGRWRGIIIVPAPAGDKHASYREGHSEKFHAPLPSVGGGGQESNKSAATGQEEGSGQARNNQTFSPPPLLTRRATIHRMYSAWS